MKPKSPAYKAIHAWMNYHFPRRGVCEECGAEKRTCYASVGHTYTRNREDWRELCYSCHALFDHGDTCRKGHSLEDAYVDKKTGKRRCRTCHRRTMRRRYWDAQSTSA